MTLAIWTYAVGESEQTILRSRCPFARSNPNDRQYVPEYVSEHFLNYCESGNTFVHVTQVYQACSHTIRLEHTQSHLHVTHTEICIVIL